MGVVVVSAWGGVSAWGEGVCLGAGGGGGVSTWGGGVSARGVSVILMPDMSR